MVPVANNEAIHKRVTIHDVARECGLSATTVSKVLSKPERDLSMRPETIQHVRKMAERLGYQPNRFAQSLRLQQSKFIGISQPSIIVDGKLVDMSLSPDLHTHECYGIGLLLIGLTNCFNLAGYTTVYMPRSEHDDQLANPNQIYPDIVDGLLYMQPSYRHQEYLEIYEKNKNIVLLGRCPENPRISSADIDNIDENHRLTKHLIHAGAEHILMIMPSDEENVAIRDRHLGYQAALKESGLPYHPEYILFQGDNQHFEADILEFLHGHGEIDAVITGAGPLTEMVIEACEKLNRRIPEDTLLAGFDITFKQKYSSPMITSIEIPYFEMAKESARILVEMIEHGNTAPVHTILPATLSIRESSIRR